MNPIATLGNSSVVEFDTGCVRRVSEGMDMMTETCTARGISEDEFAESSPGRSFSKGCRASGSGWAKRLAKKAEDLS